MSLPFISEGMTIEAFEAHMRGAGSAVYMPGDYGETIAVVHYDYGHPTEPWTYDFMGVRSDKPGSTWLYPPYIKRFGTLAQLCFWIAFVGIEYS